MGLTNGWVTGLEPAIFSQLSIFQNLSWLMIIGDYTTQYIGEEDHSA
jgi:hypothetical protein